MFDPFRIVGRGPTGSFNDDCYSSVTMESSIVDGAVSAFPFWIAYRTLGNDDRPIEF